MNSRALRTAAVSLLIAIGLPMWAAAPRGESERPRGESEKREPTLGVSRAEDEQGDSILQPEDVIKVQVFQEDDINKQADNLTISKENAVTLPLIGTISLKDLTVLQAQEKIRTLYQKDFIVNPQVTVTMVKHADRSVNVLGAVNKPGPVPFPPDGSLTIVDAISLAGGHNRLARLKEVKVTRKNGATTTHNVDDVIKKGGRDSVRLEKDDVVFVPEIIF